MNEAIRHVPENATDEQRDADATARVGKCTAQLECEKSDQGEEREDNERSIVVFEHPKSGAGVVPMTKVKETGYDGALFGAELNVVADPEF